MWVCDGSVICRVCLYGRRALFENLLGCALNSEVGFVSGDPGPLLFIAAFLRDALNVKDVLSVAVRV